MNSVSEVQKFIHFAAKKLKLTSLPKINLVGASENSKNAFGHFFSDGKTTTITVRITGRHPIDVMRTIVHELIHYKQKVSKVRKSEQMREDEANALAGRIMREYDTTNPQMFNAHPIKEEMGVAAMGGAVNNIGDKQIAMIDPLLKTGKPLSRLVKTKKLKDIKESGNGIFHKNPILSLNLKSKENTMKSRHSVKLNTNFNKIMKDEGEVEKADYKMPKGGKKISVGE